MFVATLESSSLFFFVVVVVVVVVFVGNVSVRCSAIVGGTGVRCAVVEGHVVRGASIGGAQSQLAASLVCIYYI